MKFDGVRISERRFASLLSGPEPEPYRRLDDLRDLWAWRLRLGRRHLSEEEHDIHVLATYAEQMEVARSYPWDAEEVVGHEAFLAENVAEIARLERMLRECALGSALETLASALAIAELPFPLAATPRERRAVVERAMGELRKDQRVRLRELDNAARAILGWPFELPQKLLTYAHKHQKSILVPERAPPPVVEEQLVPSPPAKPLRVDPKATWATVCNDRPSSAPKYSSHTPFEPGTWCEHPSFGMGYVVEAREGKLRVLFEGRELKLATHAPPSRKPTRT
jgi:hypothetical protein